MSTQDFDFDDKKKEVEKAIDALENETNALAKLNDEPRVMTREEAESFMAAVIRIVAMILKH